MLACYVILFESCAFIKELCYSENNGMTFKFINGEFYPTENYSMPFWIEIDRNIIQSLLDKMPSLTHCIEA